MIHWLLTTCGGTCCYRKYDWFGCWE